MSKAPRLPWQGWQGRARGAWLAMCLGLSGAAASAEIASARYEAPTTRYAHGVLGDAIEWGALVITLRDGRAFRAELPEVLVFEDIAPRLWDMDADGAPEVVVIESHQDLGARLAIWDETGRLTATPHIGTRNRWLAPVAAADFDGDGAVEIAFVDRPHLAKTLRIWRYRDGALSQADALPGFSNHRIGWDYIEGGLRDCGQGPEMVLASGNWSDVVAVRFDGALTARRLGAYSAAGVREALACR